MKNNKVNQHRLPRSYYKGFTDNDSLIWSYTIGYERNNPRLINLDKPEVFTSQDYFTIFDEKGNRNLQVEDYFGKNVEDKLPQLIDRVYKEEEKCFLDPYMTLRVSLFIATSILRSDAFREDIVDFNKTLNEDKSKIEEVINDNEKISSAIRESNISIDDFIEKIFQSDDYKDENKQHVRIINSHLKKWMEIIQEMNWYLIKAPKGKNFITSDNPVHLPSSPNNADFYEKGFGIPLRNDLYIVVINKGNQVFMRHTNSPTNMKFMNAKSCVSAKKYIFSSSRNLLLAVVSRVGNSKESLRPRFPRV